jgi:hypothetical protein
MHEDSSIERNQSPIFLAIRLYFALHTDKLLQIGIFDNIMIHTTIDGYFIEAFIIVIYYTGIGEGSDGTLGFLLLLLRVFLLFSC